MHMTYDIHPLIVHFPIALLCIYSLIQILPVQRWLPAIHWRSVSSVLLFVGFLGTVAAASTGELAADLNSPNHEILELHETFASTTQIMYGILLGSQIVKLAIARWQNLSKFRISSLLLVLSNFVDRRWVTILLSILGLGALVMTGVFGGAMVYGTSADPLAAPLLQLFGIQL